MVLALHMKSRQSHTISLFLSLFHRCRSSITSSHQKEGCRHAGRRRLDPWTKGYDEHVADWLLMQHWSDITGGVGRSVGRSRDEGGRRERRTRGDRGRYIRLPTRQRCALRTCTYHFMPCKCTYVCAPVKAYPAAKLAGILSSPDVGRGGKRKTRVVLIYFSVSRTHRRR